MGHLARLVVDPYKVVRDPALKCMKRIVRRLESAAMEMPDEPEVQLSSEANKSDEASSKLGSMVGSYASWAVSSVAAKVTGKSSEEADEPPKRIGDIDRSKFKKKPVT